MTKQTDFDVVLDALELLKVFELKREGPASVSAKALQALSRIHADYEQLVDDVDSYREQHKETE